MNHSTVCMLSIFVLFWLHSGQVKSFRLYFGVQFNRNTNFFSRIFSPWRVSYFPFRTQETENRQRRGRKKQNSFCVLLAVSCSTVLPERKATKRNERIKKEREWETKKKTEIIWAEKRVESNWSECGLDENLGTNFFIPNCERAKNEQQQQQRISRFRWCVRWRFEEKKPNKIKIKKKIHRRKNVQKSKSKLNETNEIQINRSTRKTNERRGIGNSRNQQNWVKLNIHTLAYVEYVWFYWIGLTIDKERSHTIKKSILSECEDLIWNFLLSFIGSEL